MQDNNLSAAVIGAAIEVQRLLGPGLLEGAYAAALAHELSLRGIGFERELPMPVTYKGAFVGLGFRVDLLVERQLVVELKAIQAVLPVHRAQLLSYLRISRKRLGLLINFHEWPLARGIHRIADRTQPR